MKLSMRRKLNKDKFKEILLIKFKLSFANSLLVFTFIETYILELTHYNFVNMSLHSIRSLIKLMKGKALRKHSLQEKTAASVLLKLFISSNEWCHTTDAPLVHTMFSLICCHPVYSMPTDVDLWRSGLEIIFLCFIFYEECYKMIYEKFIVLNIMI